MRIILVFGLIVSFLCASLPSLKGDIEVFVERSFFGANTRHISKWRMNLSLVLAKIKIFLIYFPFDHGGGE